mmetsp:Transcript_63748/g.178390  ORF Transcript_63748/g.178390 Transcript_63748/m.178390 type:complete len:345 (+) Transcript_63748:80-1114(+)
MFACLRLSSAAEPQPAAIGRKHTVDQEGVFIKAPAHIREDVDAAVASGIEQVQTSLFATRLDLGWDELSVPEERRQAVRCTYDDLCEYAKRPPTGSTGSDGLSRSSTLAPDDNEDSVGDSNDDSPPEEISPEHRAQAVYESRGLDYGELQGTANSFLQRIRVRPHEVGSRNYSKWRGRTLWNQCFYLSLSHGYLGPKASVRRVRGLARRMRRAIEAVVLEKHPSWAAGLEASTSGKGQAMVFADFLPLAMRSKSVPEEKNLLAKMVVCIMDSVNGHVEVYIGPAYNQLEDPAEQARNLVLLWYKPAHYQALVRDDDEGSKLDCTYDEFKRLLSMHGVVFIETNE